MHACQPDAAALHDAAAAVAVLDTVAVSAMIVATAAPVTAALQDAAVVGAVLAAAAVSATIVALAAPLIAAAVGATIVAPAASVAAQCASGWVAYPPAADLHAPSACSSSHA
jgi:hypothetical protein